MKRVLLVLVVALMAVFAVTAVAQETNTIADIVVASAGSDTPEFATLLAAVSAADPAVLEALSDPEAELTVFAPTDAAFAALAEALGDEAFAAVLADPAALTNILLFHVVSGVVPSADLVATLEAGGGSASVPSLQGQNIDFVLNEDGSITVNGNANLVLDMVDIAADNGIIHVIDAVILPETRTIAEIVIASTESETPEFTGLLGAVLAADPSVVETLSDPAAELTVFAPTDQAFADLEAALGSDAFAGVVADPAALTDILLYHVLPGVYYAGDIAGAADMAMMGDLPEGVMMNDDGSLTVTMANGDTATVTIDADGNVFINDAQVVAVDIEAANGVIHVINAVIVPPM
jgi:uncharacterized surface protein with fasciclin (FAS1) repeats